MMKPLTMDEFYEKHEVFATIFCVIYIILIIVSIATVETTEPAVLRNPSDGYETLEEEYIAAIDSYLHDGNTVASLPKESVFSIDERNRTVTIRDIETGSNVSCHLVLNDTIPVYTWTHTKVTLPLGELIIRYFNSMLIVTIFALLTLLSVYGIYFMFFYIKNPHNKKYKINTNNDQNDDADISNGIFKNLEKYHCDTCACNKCRIFFEECQCAKCFNGDQYTIVKRKCYWNNDPSKEYEDEEDEVTEKDEEIPDSEPNKIKDFVK